MHLDRALNWAWLLFGLLALSGTIRSGKVRPRWLRVVGVMAVVIALFPYISATDDQFTLEHSSSQPASGQTLLLLYETVATPLIFGICGLAVTLVFSSLFISLLEKLLDRVALLQAGRSPPTYFGFV